MTTSYRPIVRLKAEVNGPLRSMNDYQFGFYDTGFLRQAVQSLSQANAGQPVTFKMATLPVPQNPFEFRIAEAIVRHPHVSYAIVDKDKMAFVIVDACPGWLEAFKRLGYQVYSGDKTAKRLKTFHRPALLNATFAKDEINVVVVESTAYSPYNYQDPEMLCSLKEDYPGVDFQDPKVLSRLLDGGFVISPKLIQRAVANLPVYEPSKTTDTKEYYYDWRIRKNLVRNMLKQRVFNARLVFDKGFLKGNCIVSDSLPEGVDVITSIDNIKSEIVYDNGFQFLAEPQGSHERVITDDQTLINLPNLFRQSDLECWLNEDYEKMFNDAVNSRLLTNWREIYKRQFRNLADAEDEEANSRMSYVGYRWVAAGMNITDSPWLFETLATSHAKPYQTRIPVPCSVYEQIIPESLAHMAGYQEEVYVEKGEIIRLNELGIHVVNDADWLEMYESHGGHDEDDYFKLFYRTMEGGDMDGQKVVVVCRSPNGYGEYSIFKYVEGQWSPTWYKADGTQVKFPAVPGRGWPKRLSESIRDRQVRYEGLPSEYTKKVKRSGPYTQDDVVADMKVAMSGGNVGGYVNALMAHSLVVHKHRPVQLCSMEKAIDKCINPDSVEDVLAIDDETKKIVREIIDFAQPIDTNFWLKRGFKRYLKEDETVVLHEGKITQMNLLCLNKYSEYCLRVREWAQVNAGPPEIVHQLGKRLYYQALPIVRNFRSTIYSVNTSETTQSTGTIVRGSWESLYSEIVNIVESFERIEDRHDFVLSMFSVSLKVPTSSGKITDQIVMNRFVYPYLESALQFYGIANTVFFTAKKDGDIEVHNTKSDKWQYNGQMYNDPMSFQEAHRVDTQVVFTPVTQFTRTSNTSRY
jgi:hypothetical protein